MTHMLDVIQDYLAYRHYSYERLDGSVRGDERYLAVKNFASETNGAFIFLLSTRAGGVGLNLTAADTVIFIDSDFNPTADQQAAVSPLLILLFTNLFQGSRASNWTNKIGKDYTIVDRRFS